MLRDVLILCSCASVAYAWLCAVVAPVVRAVKSVLNRGALPLELLDTLPPSREALLRDLAEARGADAALARRFAGALRFFPGGFAPPDPPHALSRAASPARSVRVAHSLRSFGASRTGIASRVGGARTGRRRDAAMARDRRAGDRARDDARAARGARAAPQSSVLAGLGVRDRRMGIAARADAPCAACRGCVRGRHGARHRRHGQRRSRHPGARPPGVHQTRRVTA